MQSSFPQNERKMRNFDIENDRWLQDVYIGEVKHSCDQVMLSVKGINNSMKQSGVEKTFFFLRSLVTNAAMVSQFFWPASNNKGAQLRGKTLRDRFAMDDSSVLNNRKFRHHLIHFDERLDAWSVESQHRNLARRLIGPRNMVGVTCH